MGYTNYYCMDLLRLLLFTASIVISGADESDDDLTMTNDDDYNSQVATVSAYLPKPFACISMVCSFVMVREIIADHRQPNAAAVSNGDPIKRMLLSNAVADLLFSLAYFLTTWPSPHDDVTWGITGNIGNTLTCTIQGFILQLGFVASVIFSAGLSIFYFLTIQFGWKMHHLEKIEKVVQSFIWLTALAAAVYPIPIELYNNNYDVCWLDSYPGDCSGDDCIRGSNPRPHQLAFVILPWSCMALVLAVMMQLFWTVRQIENMSKKYATSTMPTSTTISNGDLGEADNGPRELNYQIYVDRRKSLAVAKQAIFYAVAFLAMHLLNLISTARYYISGDWNDVFDYIAYGVLFTSPGTLNLMVFLRTRIEMATPEGRFLRRFFCCSCALFGYNVTSDLIHLQAPTEQAPTNTADPSNSETKHDFRDYDFIHGVRIDI